MPAIAMSPHALALFLLFSSVTFPFAASTADGDALRAAMASWQAPVPTDWTGDDPCQSWEGVTCDSSSRVTELDLSNKGLTGPIPSEIGNLQSLVKLDIGNAINSPGNSNRVTGDFSALTALTELKTLNASFNIVNAGFPTAVLQLTGLSELRLDNALLTGSFPAGLSNLKNLQYLYLGNNSMSGSLPSELGSLTNLVELSLWGLNFSSLIPSELGALTSLRYLTLHNCGLFGGLPIEFQNLRSMQKLFLYGNTLTGPIPDTWQKMENLQQLRLEINYLTNSFPSWIESLPSLIYVDISYNNFYGSVPNFTNTQLKILNIACNFFTGSSPGSPPGLNLTVSPSCFGKASDADNRRVCNSFYTCSEFAKGLSTNGGCPQCPTGQIFSDESSCVCSEDQGSGSQSKSFGIGKVAGVVAGTALFLVLGFLGFLTFKKWRNQQSPLPQMPANFKYESKFNVKGPREFWEAPKGVQRFSLEELAKATSDFDSKHEIGAGGFGKVFYGHLENGKQVAIKRASTFSLQGSSEFRNEVELLSRLHHRNLVRLEGFCDDSDMQILVYEYVPNGNLHTHLFQNDAGHSFTWLRRLDVAVGIAQGLDYLHSFADPPVIHRDVKPSNILLDNNLVAKVADFGISKTTIEFETHISTTPAGTAGYIDPQYFLRRQLTTASDVYGFGVVLLELITGQKAIDPFRMQEHNLVEWVKVTMKVDGLEGIVDSRWDGNYPKQIYKEIAQLAMDCASFNKNERPSMKTAVTILDNCLRAVCPPPHAMNVEQEEHAYLQILEEEENALRRSEETTFNSTLAASKSAFKGSALMPR